MIVNRRGFLMATGAMALAAQAARAASGSRRVVVIGGGIIGASIAYHLAKTGAKVTILDKTGPAAGATMCSFAWLNAGSKRPRPYHQMNLLGLLGWHQLQDELGIAALPVQWGGTVDWTAGAKEADQMRASIARQQAWGYPIRMIEPGDVTRLLPGITPGAIDAVSFSEVEGTVNPVIATRALLKAAQAHGAKLEFPVTVTGFDRIGGKVTRVLTSGGAIDCDEIVLAAGLDCQPLAAMLGANVPIETSLGVLAHTVPRPMALPRLAYAPGANIKQNPDGSYVTGASFAGTPDVKGTREEGEALLATARRFVPAMRGARLDQVTLGRRVLPKDSFPIVGHLPRVENAYVAAMHSGMTQAPLIGQVAAVEILSRTKADLLDTFRPERFA